MPGKDRRSKLRGIQFASDLHLEFEQGPSDRLRLPVARGTGVIVLAGDVHTDIQAMDAFVRELAGQVPVVMVAGNHEFFDHDLDDTLARLHAWAAGISGVHFLENEAVELDGITFLGATLWSNFDGADPRLMKVAPSLMADYSLIADGSDPRGRLRPSRILAEHRRSIAFIERELRVRDPARTVVVTHHAPSLRSSRCKGEDYDRLYGSDCDALIRDCGPALWVHGHVHESFDYTVGRTRVVCNPRGYPGYATNPRFDRARAVTLPRR